MERAQVQVLAPHLLAAEDGFDAPRAFDRRLRRRLRRALGRGRAVARVVLARLLERAVERREDARPAHALDLGPVRAVRVRVERRERGRAARHAVDDVRDDGVALHRGLGARGLLRERLDGEELERFELLHRRPRGFEQGAAHDAAAARRRPRRRLMGRRRRCTASGLAAIPPYRAAGGPHAKFRARPAGVEATTWASARSVVAGGVQLVAKS
mmetsp:Transcript_31086/g.93183  ORF Transcript_31086/g.93183 Transcript_31086/m.93183 type:complete len:213 (+) Transcript_31086:1171-1809(+)